MATQPNSINSSNIDSNTDICQEMSGENLHADPDKLVADIKNVIFEGETHFNELAAITEALFVLCEHLDFKIPVNRSVNALVGVVNDNMRFSASVVDQMFSIVKNYEKPSEQNLET